MSHKLSKFLIGRLVVQSHMRQADTLEKMEALLPFNVKSEELDAARAVPELIYPEKECGQLSAYVFSCVECFLQAMPIGWSHKTFFVEAREFRIKRTVGSRG